MVVIKRGQRGRDFHKFQLQSLESRHDPCLYFHTWNFFKNGLTFKYLQKLHSLLKHLKQALPCPRENACKLYFGKTTRGQYQKEFFCQFVLEENDDGGAYSKFSSEAIFCQTQLDPADSLDSSRLPFSRSKLLKEF